MWNQPPTFQENNKSKKTPAKDTSQPKELVFVDKSGNSKESKNKIEKHLNIFDLLGTKSFIK